MTPNPTDGDNILTLYTIGHSNFSPDEFLDMLRRHEITILVDVRTRPVSGYVPHFNKDKLSVFLEKRGVQYRFAGKYLGGQPDDPTVYKSGSIPDPESKREQFRKDIQYETVMARDWYQTGLHHLLDILRQSQTANANVAIMCSEGNPRECHRHHLIARSLIDPQIRVVDVPISIIHISRDGEPEILDPAEFNHPPESTPQQLSLF
jgi:uncharacterized protein (DUF488 family)